ncbi:hypothetical protein R0K20_15720, partial [Staphylococcus sp. SIMBA_130]
VSTKKRHLFSIRFEHTFDSGWGDERYGHIVVNRTLHHLLMGSPFVLREMISRATGYIVLV